MLFNYYTCVHKIRKQSTNFTFWNLTISCFSAKISGHSILVHQRTKQNTFAGNSIPCWSIFYTVNKTFGVWKMLNIQLHNRNVMLLSVWFLCQINFTKSGWEISKWVYYSKNHMRNAHQLFRVFMHRFNFILIDSEITSSSNMHFLSQKRNEK